MATFDESTTALKDGKATWISCGFVHDEHDLNKNFMVESNIAVDVFSFTVEVRHFSANDFWYFAD